MKNLKIAAAALAISVLALTACGGKSGGTLSTVTAADMNAAARVGEYKAEAVYQETAAAAMEEAGSGEVTDTTPLTAPAPQGRKLIRTVDLAVETTEFQTLVTQITDRTAALGGYIESSSITGGSLSPANQSIPKYASLTARIPSDKLDAFLKEVEEAGNVTNRSESTADITLNYSDLESRKKTLLVEQDRIWALLEKAESLETIIMLEQRLTDIRYELESYESQLRSYDDRIAYSTVTMTVNEVVDLSPLEPEGTGTRIQKGFMKNLNLIIGGVSAFLIWLITCSPILIFLAVIIIVIILIVRMIIKKKSLSPAVKAPEETNSSDQ